MLYRHEAVVVLSFESYFFLVHTIISWHIQINGQQRKPLALNLCGSAKGSYSGHVKTSNVSQFK